MRQRLNIPRRIFIGFLLVLAVSGLVSVASFVQHRRTAATLRLLHEGYLPLALVVGQARATQAVFETLLDRILSERDTAATRRWLNLGRVARPQTVDKALRGVTRIEELAPASFEQARVGRLRRELNRINNAVARGEERYVSLYRALDVKDRPAAERILGDLRGREREIDNRLEALWASILEQFERTSARASQQQSQSIGVLVGLIAISLLVGVAVTWWSQQVLSPLPRLQERVEAVARGDLAAQRLVPTTDDEIGRLARQFEAMVTAIGARDSSLRQAAERLRLLQQMQEQIVAGLRAAVLVVDGEGVVRSANPAASTLTGVDGAAVGRPLEQSGLLGRLEPLGAAIAEVTGGAERSVLAAAALKGPAQRQLNVLVTPFGEEPEPGARRSVLIVAEDVTEELETKARLIQTERLAAIGRMAAHVTHEVRSPLSSIGLNVELLEEELGERGEETRSLLRAIQREIESLTAITEQYLRLARLPNPTLEQEDLGELVGDAVRFLRPELEANGIDVRLQIDDGLPQVAVDEAQIRQVLVNLLKNAREAMPEGGEVKLQASARDAGVVILIRDQGAGMEADQRQQMFEPFYTTKKFGTGLGLPLTQQIMAAHGGRIECESQPGEGTLFELWFPVPQAEAEAPFEARV